MTDSRLSNLCNQLQTTLVKISDLELFDDYSRLTALFDYLTEELKLRDQLQQELSVEKEALLEQCEDLRKKFHSLQVEHCTIKSENEHLLHKLTEGYQEGKLPPTPECVLRVNLKTRTTEKATEINGEDVLTTEVAPLKPSINELPAERDQAGERLQMLESNSGHLDSVNISGLYVLTSSIQNAISRLSNNKVTSEFDELSNLVNRLMGELESKSCHLDEIVAKSPDFARANERPDNLVDLTLSEQEYKDYKITHKLQNLKGKSDEFFLPIKSNSEPQIETKSKKTCMTSVPYMVDALLDGTVVDQATKCELRTRKDQAVGTNDQLQLSCEIERVVGTSNSSLRSQLQTALTDVSGSFCPDDFIRLSSFLELCLQTFDCESSRLIQLTQELEHQMATLRKNNEQIQANNDSLVLAISDKEHDLQLARQESSSLQEYIKASFEKVTYALRQAQHGTRNLHILGDQCCQPLTDFQNVIAFWNQAIRNVDVKQAHTSDQDSVILLEIQSFMNHLCRLELATEFHRLLTQFRCMHDALRVLELRRGDFEAELPSHLPIFHEIANHFALLLSQMPPLDSYISCLFVTSPTTSPQPHGTATSLATIDTSNLAHSLPPSLCLKSLSLQQPPFIDISSSIATGFRPLESSSANLDSLKPPGLFAADPSLRSGICTSPQTTSSRTDRSNLGPRPEDEMGESTPPPIMQQPHSGDTSLSDVPGVRRDNQSFFETLANLHSTGQYSYDSGQEKVSRTLLLEEAVLDAKRLSRTRLLTLLQLVKNSIVSAARASESSSGATFVRDHELDEQRITNNDLLRYNVSRRSQQYSYKFTSLTRFKSAQSLSKLISPKTSILAPCTQTNAQLSRTLRQIHQILLVWLQAQQQFISASIGQQTKASDHLSQYFIDLTSLLHHFNEINSQLNLLMRKLTCTYSTQAGSSDHSVYQASTTLAYPTYSCSDVSRTISLLSSGVIHAPACSYHHPALPLYRMSFLSLPDLTSLEDCLPTSAPPFSDGVLLSSSQPPGWLDSNYPSYLSAKISGQTNSLQTTHKSELVYATTSFNSQSSVDTVYIPIQVLSRIVNRLSRHFNFDGDRLIRLVSSADLVGGDFASVLDEIFGHLSNRTSAGYDEEQTMTSSLISPQFSISFKSTCELVKHADLWIALLRSYLTSLAEKVHSNADLSLRNWQHSNLADIGASLRGLSYSLLTSSQNPDFEASFSDLEDSLETVCSELSELRAVISSMISAQESGQVFNGYDNCPERVISLCFNISQHLEDIRVKYLGHLSSTQKAEVKTASFLSDESFRQKELIQANTCSISTQTYNLQKDDCSCKVLLHTYSLPLEYAQHEPDKQIMQATSHRLLHTAIGSHQSFGAEFTDPGDCICQEETLSAARLANMGVELPQLEPSLIQLSKKTNATPADPAKTRPGPGLTSSVAVACPRTTEPARVQDTVRIRKKPSWRHGKLTHLSLEDSFPVSSDRLRGVMPQSQPDLPGILMKPITSPLVVAATTSEQTDPDEIWARIHRSSSLSFSSRHSRTPPTMELEIGSQMEHNQPKRPFRLDLNVTAPEDELSGAEMSEILSASRADGEVGQEIQTSSHK
ncbi:unnamed protein product, partial [Protopolystoma xenopodis]